jgi:hypothetical protein
MTDTLHKLHEQQALVEKRGNYLKQKADECTAKARAATQSGNKEAALYELKRRKQYTSQLEHLDGLSMNLLVQITEIEKAIFNKEQMAVMEQGVRALKSARGSTTTEQVERLADEIQETLHTANEIQAVLSRPLMDVDTDEFEDELKALTTSTIPLPALPEPPILQFPPVPGHVPRRTGRKDDDDDMRELQASMAM